MDAPALLLAQGISKSFGVTRVLKQVDFEVRKGEIHGLLGENGAGKSTLIKILAGDYSADEGQVFYEGTPVYLRSPADSRALGIRVIYQEFNLVLPLSVAENICLGSLPAAAFPGTVNWSAVKRRAADVLARLGEEIPVDVPVRQLSVAQQQIVEIAKALSQRSTVLIMDEPTSALNDQETEHLFSLLRALRREGVSIVYITHRIDELFDLADRATVLRDGEVVGTVDISSTSPTTLVQMMIGRELREMYPKRQVPIGDKVLEVKSLSVGAKVRDVSFQVRKGEIVAVFGLLGAGQSDLAKALFGLVPIDSGEVVLEGRQVQLGSPAAARLAGVGMVPDDRKRAGLVGALGVAANISLAALPRYASIGIIDRGLERRECSVWSKRLGIRCTSLSQPVRYLSGGNQQKTIIARWAADRSKVLIMDQPTRGVDVGAKIEIYRLLEDLCEQGVGVVMVSIEVPEVLGIADTIYVMYNGRITGQFSRGQATQHELVQCAAGVHQAEVATQ